MDTTTPDLLINEMTLKCKLDSNDILSSQNNLIPVIVPATSKAKQEIFCISLTHSHRICVDSSCHWLMVAASEARPHLLYLLHRSCPGDTCTQKRAADTS